MAQLFVVADNFARYAPPVHKSNKLSEVSAQQLVHILVVVAVAASCLVVPAQDLVPVVPAAAACAVLEPVAAFPAVVAGPVQRSHFVVAFESTAHLQRACPRYVSHAHLAQGTAAQPNHVRYRRSHLALVPPLGSVAEVRVSLVVVPFH